MMTEISCKETWTPNFMIKLGGICKIKVNKSK